MYVDGGGAMLFANKAGHFMRAVKHDDHDHDSPVKSVGEKVVHMLKYFCARWTDGSAPASGRQAQ